MKVIENGGLTTPQGFEAAAVACGIKASGNKDLSLVYSPSPAAVSAAFTANQVAAAPVVVSKANLGTTAQAIILNSGNANAVTGAAGIDDARAMVALTAARLGLAPGQVLVASTGIIGHPLPMAPVRDGIAALEPAAGPAADLAFAEGIMTTDAFPKHLAVEVELSGGPVAIGGSAKGAGMIAPDLAPHATMIAIVTTDAPLGQQDLDGFMAAAIAGSFNVITVDGDTSTNDCLFALANGRAGEFGLSAGDRRALREAFNYVCLRLAKMIVRDGEGATRLIEYTVTGAQTPGDAVTVAKTVADSLLVKTAFFGRDPNWGRILAAIGRSGVSIDPDRLEVDIGGAAVVRSGLAVETPGPRLALAMESEEIQVRIGLNLGAAQATVYGSDLSYDYVKLNAEYTT
jgi:glutamate N-acetyltransferase / amino-acid N-acetyltransferase